MRKLASSLTVVVLCAASGAHATDLRNVITDVTITSWDQKDGLPAATIMALAQSADGYLWIGSREGLLRFDGVRFSGWEGFSKQPLPHAIVLSLCAGQQGDLWIGFGERNGIGRLVNGQLTVYSATEGLWGTTVWTIVEDTQGVIWSGTDQGLFSFESGEWSHWGVSKGLPEGAVYSVYVNREGTLYVAHEGGVFRRSGDNSHFERVDELHDAIGGLAQSPDGTMWLTDPTVGYRALGSNVSSVSVARQGRGIRTVADHDGNLWIGTGGQGLWRVRDWDSAVAGVVERTNSLTGLHGDGVYSLLEDREGNIWAGTTEGLNRVTPRTINQVIDLGLVRGIEEASSGQLWVGTVDELFTFTDGRGVPKLLPVGSELQGMAADRDTLWLATHEGLLEVKADGQRSFVSLSLGSPYERMASITSDSAGGLWVTTEANALFHWRHGTLLHLELPSDVSGARISATFADSDGHAWLAFDNGRIVRTSLDDTLDILPQEGTARPLYRAIFEDSRGQLWFGGDGVLARLRHDGLVTLWRSELFPIPRVTAIVTDDVGSLWLGTSSGVMHLEPAEFDRAVADASHSPHYTLYDRSDGIAGTPLGIGFARRAVHTRDGRLWFVTTRGITVFDPRALRDRPGPGPVRFEGAVVDSQRVFPGAPLTLPPGTRTLELDYTVVNLTAPLKTLFRYRLEPFDREWIDAGKRRQAFYTNLPPGRYQFHVMVSSGGVPSSDTSSTWDVAVSPRFYQTTSFALLCVGAVGLAVLAGWRVRERHLRKEFSILLAERARLGREIHDTLLQGLVGIALQFDGLAHDVATSPQARGKLTRLRDRVEDYIREARRSIWNLHHPATHSSLIDALRRAGAVATEGQRVDFQLGVSGTPLVCDRSVEEQLVRIAQEATLNAVRHGAPNQIRVHLGYEESAILLQVRDDGRGFDPSEARALDHYGLASMEARAGSVGGRVTLTSSPGRGTEVSVFVPV